MLAGDLIRRWQYRIDNFHVQAKLVIRNLFNWAWGCVFVPVAAGGSCFGRDGILP